MNLSTKISLLLVVVVAISGLVIGSLSITSTSESFDRYIRDMRQTDMAEWQVRYLAYYGYHGESWVGVESLLISQDAGSSTPAFWTPVVLISNDQTILAHPLPEVLGMKITDEMLDRAAPLFYKDDLVGYTIPVDYFNRNYWLLEERFNQDVAVSVIRGIVITGLVAVLTGLTFSKKITGPLNRLRDNVRLMGRQGRLAPMPVYSDDEIGDLTHAFNLMGKELEKSNQMRTQVLGDISHELRTPLTAVLGKLENTLMANRNLAPEETSALYDELLRLNGLVQEIQNLSKIDAGHMDLSKTLIDFKSFFEDFFIIMEAEAVSRHITVEVTLDEDLPYAYADAERFRQIVLNLVSNALRYTPDGGLVTLSASSDNRYFILEVKDTGIGMSAEDLDHIFDRFYRSDYSRARETGGTGLGMAITKGLVKAHNGHIDAKSVLGQGTSFTVRLPLYRPEEE